jgi:TolB-like protein/cytochrome c-type biogenesis protein CcmH/NrfG
MPAAAKGAGMVNHFLSELRRRGVLQTITAYVVGAWLIIEVFDVAGPMFAVPSWVNSLVGICFLAGFPVAAYLSWFFNYSDGSLHRTLDASGETPLPLTVWHWAGLGTVTVAAAAMGFVIYEGVSDRLRKSEEGIEFAGIDESIAILPFEDLSPERDQAYLAEGVAAEIASLLGRTDGVRTAATSATFRLAKSGAAPLDISRQLSTQSVLTGSINATGNRVRIRAELARSDDGTVIWSDTFTRTVSDIFTLEEEIARSITNILVDRYVEADDFTRQPRTESSDAYVFYLKARAELRNRTTESVKAARKLFEQSVALDPEYAPALVGIAETMWQLADGDENYGTLDPEVAASVARTSLERALLIDDSLPEAYASLGRVEALLKNHDVALAHYDKSTSLNPSLVDVHIWRYLTLNELGRYSESMAALEQAAQLDPTAPAILHNLGFEESRRGDFDAARRHFEKLIDLEPDNPLGYRGLAAAAFREGELALSLREWRRAMALSPDTPLYSESVRGVLFGLRMLDEFRPLALEAGDEANVLLLEGDFDALHERMEFSMAANPDDPWLRFEAGWYRYLDGDSGRGDTLILAADSAFSDEDRYSMPMCSPAIETIPALRRSGQAEEADRYLQQCESRLARARQSVFEDNFLDHLAARIAVLRDDKEQAIEHMRDALLHGWREWWTHLDPVLAPISHEPGMKRIIAEIDEELERQRAEARMDALAQAPE